MKRFLGFILVVTLFSLPATSIGLDTSGDSRELKKIQVLANVQTHVWKLVRAGGDPIGSQVAISEDYMVTADANTSSEEIKYYMIRATGYDEPREWMYGNKLHNQSSNSILSPVDLDGDRFVAGFQNSDGADTVGFAKLFQFPMEAAALFCNTGVNSSSCVPNDGFGSAVAISGDNVIVGAQSADRKKGAIYFFSKKDDEWVKANLRVRPKIDGIDIGPSSYFGASVDISGDWAGVGAVGIYSNKGAVYMYQIDSSVWSFKQEIKAPDDDTLLFGSDVAIDGDRMVIIAANIGATRGRIYIYKKDSTGIWIYEDMIKTERLIGSAAISGEKIAVARDHSRSDSIPGAVPIYKYDSSSGKWVEETTLLISKTGLLGDYSLFGRTISMNGNYLAVGVENVAGSSGTALVYFDSPVPTQTALLELEKHRYTDTGVDGTDEATRTSDGTGTGDGSTDGGAGTGTDGGSIDVGTGIGASGDGTAGGAGSEAEPAPAEPAANKARTSTGGCSLVVR